MACACLSCSKNIEETFSQKPIEFRISETLETKSFFNPAAESSLTSVDGAATLNMSVCDNVQPSTKGVMVTTADLNQLGVWSKLSDGQNYFYDLTFTRADDGIFYPVQKYYWIPGETLQFYCYSPMSNEFAVSGLTLSGMADDPTVTCKTIGNVFTHKDFCVGYLASSGETNDVTLHHMFSAVQFKVGNNLPVGTKISSIEIQNLCGSGTCSLANPKEGWKLNTSVRCSSFIMFNEGSEWERGEKVADGDVIGSTFFLLPQELTEDDDCCIQIVRKEADAMIPYNFRLTGKWEMGKVYTFTLNLVK